MKNAAAILTVVAFVLAGIGVYQYHATPTEPMNISELEITLKTLNDQILNAQQKEDRQSDVSVRLAREINQGWNQKTVDPKIEKLTKELLNARDGGTSSDRQLEQAKQSTERLNLQVERLKEQPMSTKAEKDWFSYIPKVVFSLLLCLASLYVILKGGYSESTEKWAFAMINIIVGVWIGTVTS